MTASLEWRKEIAVKGRGCMVTKMAAIQRTVDLLRASTLWDLFGDMWTQPAFYSIVLQVLISAMFQCSLRTSVAITIISTITIILSTIILSTITIILSIITIILSTITIILSTIITGRVLISLTSPAVPYLASHQRG